MKATTTTTTATMIAMAIAGACYAGTPDACREASTRGVERSNALVATISMMQGAVNRGDVSGVVAHCNQLDAQYALIESVFDETMIACSGVADTGEIRRAKRTLEPAYEGLRRMCDALRGWR